MPAVQERQAAAWILTNLCSYPCRVVMKPASGDFSNNFSHQNFLCPASPIPQCFPRRSIWSSILDKIRAASPYHSRLIHAHHEEHCRISGILLKLQMHKLSSWQSGQHSPPDISDPLSNLVPPGFESMSSTSD